MWMGYISDISSYSRSFGILYAAASVCGLAVAEYYLDSGHVVWPSLWEDSFCRSITFAIIERKTRSSNQPDVAKKTFSSFEGKVW
jgi:hypothetical protein